MKASLFFQKNSPSSVILGVQKPPAKDIERFLYMIRCDTMQKSIDLPNVKLTSKEYFSQKSVRAVDGVLPWFVLNNNFGKNEGLVKIKPT